MVRHLAGRRAFMLGALLFGALGLRIAYILALRDTPAGRYLLIDSAFYAERARRIAAGLGWGPEPYFMNPLYPYLLAPLRPWEPHGPLVVGLVQAAAGVVTVLLVAWLARRWFGAVAGRAAAALAALYGPLWFYDGAILTASPILLASAAMLASLERWHDARRRRWLLVAGGCAGIAALLRPSVLLFVLVAPLCLEIARVARTGSVAGPSAGAGAGRRAARWRTIVASAVLLAGASGAVVLPAIVRNQRVAGEMVLTTSAGMNFYTGNQPGASGIYDGAPFVTSYEPPFERADFQREAERRHGGPLSPGAVSRFWLREGCRAIAADPWRWLALEARKLWLIAHHVEAQNNLSIYVVEDWVPLLRWNPFGYRLLVPLAVAGLVVNWRRRRALAVPLGFGAAHVAAMLVFFVSSEYRLPLVLVLIPAAGAAVAAVRERWRGGAVPAARAAVLAAVLVAVLGSWESDLTRRLTLKRVDYLNFATLAEGAGEPAAALALLARALVIDPDYRPALARQAALADRVGLEAVADASRARLAALPAARDEIQLWDVDRAVALYQAGRYQDALDVFVQLATGAGASARIDNNIGLCLYKLSRLDEAETVLRAVVARSPDYERARHNLALVLRARGATPAAIEMLHALIASTPGHWRSHLKLIEWAVEDGALESARAGLAELRALGAPPAVMEHAASLVTPAGDGS